MLTFFLVFQSSTTKENLREPDTSEFDITDYDWLVGHWEGNGFGGVSEEIWAPAVDGTMMGMFRHMNDGKLVFYEFILLDEEGMRLKHFHPDIKGWETKDDFVQFQMVEFSENMLVMKGLTIEKKSESNIEIRLKMRRNETVETEVFSMHRVD